MSACWIIAAARTAPGTGVKTVNVSELDVPPQVTVADGVHPLGGGVSTVTGTVTVPVNVRSVAGIAAVSPFTDVKVVIRWFICCLPFQ
jgi:hypothetical protein